MTLLQQALLPQAPTGRHRQCRAAVALKKQLALAPAVVHWKSSVLSAQDALRGTPACTPMGRPQVGRQAGCSNHKSAQQNCF